MCRINLIEFETSELLPLTDEEVRYLQEHHQKHLSVERCGGEYRLHANHHVGFIQLSGKAVYLQPKIPDDNLLFIISYLYDQVEIAEDITFSEDEPNTILDLMIVLLIEWANRLIKRGVHRRYVKKVEHIPRVRGKIIPARNLFYFDKLWCAYEDLSHSVDENMILKATLRLLLSRNTPDMLKARIKILIKLLSDIRDIELTARSFHNIRYSRLNQNYRGILKLCYLLFTQYSIHQISGDVLFQSFLIDMNAVFEEFVRKYLQDHLPEETVSKRMISEWAVGQYIALLPAMIPDIVIRGKLVIDVKYYKSIFGANNKFHSHNLYQMLSYMEILGLNGMLVYPETPSSGNIDAEFTTGNKAFYLKTLDMRGTYMHFQRELQQFVEGVRQTLRVLT